MRDSMNEEETNDTENWLKWYWKQIELNPRSTMARYKLGRLLEKLGKYEEALVQLKNVISIDANHLAARMAIEEVLSQMEVRREPFTSKHVAG